MLSDLAKYMPLTISYLIVVGFETGKLMYGEDSFEKSTWAENVWQKDWHRRRPWWKES
jgi:hypothetical protein